MVGDDLWSAENRSRHPMLTSSDARTDLHGRCGERGAGKSHVSQIWSLDSRDVSEA